MPPKKVKSREFLSDSDDPDYAGDKPKKKARVDTAAASGSDDETMIPLSAKRFVSLQNFHGKYLVSIREYYEDDGQMKPGRKGISLSLDQWEKLKAAIPKIDEQLEGKT